jgi:hypothetical protein
VRVTMLMVMTLIRICRGLGDLASFAAFVRHRSHL